MNKKSVLIIFLGNFFFDSRATNFYKSLTDRGYAVEVISFDWLTKDFKTQKKGDISVYKLKKVFFSIGFYFKFAVIISFKLLLSKTDLIFAEDVYTLPFAVIFSKIKKSKVFYDSREVYGHLAGLKRREKLQAFWGWVEKNCINSVNLVITTGEMDSKHIEEEYGLPGTMVIRNLPFNAEIKETFNFRKQLNFERGKKILLYQGVILHGRGLEIIFDIMPELKDCVLIILGDGEHKEYYEDLAKKKKLEDKVFFLGKFKQEELLKYTAGADVGLAIIENLSLSYYFALPNKMFEYIYCGVPVLASNLPQMKSIIEKYNVGICVDAENKNDTILQLNNLLYNNELMNELKRNCHLAAAELNWNVEITKLFTFIEENI